MNLICNLFFSFMTSYSFFLCSCRHVGTPPGQQAWRGCTDCQGASVGAERTVT